jgi:hypothetical protein
MLRIKKWHGKMELRTLTHLTIHPEPPAMDLNQMFGNSQPEASAPSFSGTRDINAVEPLKDARLISLRDADTGVRDG